MNSVHGDLDDRVRMAPRALTIASILILIQLYRLVGGLFLVEWQRGNLPAAFALPAGIGDVLVGITAPLVALALRRGGLRTWAVALLWNALGLADLAVAFTEGALAGAPFILTSYLVVLPTIAVPIATALHIATIVLLARKGVPRALAARIPAA